jgi:hypothetical protein
MIAITSRICIRPPAWKAKNPSAQPIISNTARIYNRPLILFLKAIKTMTVPNII